MAIPNILAKVTWDAEIGIANKLILKIIFIFSIISCEEKNNKTKIWVNKIASAEMGFIFDTLDPILWMIFLEKNKAPNPIHNDPEKNRKFSTYLN